MNKGKWYITFTWWNSSEPDGGDCEHEEILLNSTTENEALAEAKALADSNKDIKTSGGRNMPIPQGYAVIYKILPQQK